MSGINTKFCGRRGLFQLGGQKKALRGRKNLSWMYKEKKKGTYRRRKSWSWRRLLGEILRFRSHWSFGARTMWWNSCLRNSLDTVIIVYVWSDQDLTYARWYEKRKIAWRETGKKEWNKCGKPWDDVRERKELKVMSVLLSLNESGWPREDW